MKITLTTLTLLAILAAPVMAQKGLTMQEVAARQAKIAKSQRDEVQAKMDTQGDAMHRAAVQRTRDRNDKFLRDHPDLPPGEIARLGRHWKSDEEQIEEDYEDRKGEWKKQLKASDAQGQMLVDGVDKAGGIAGWSKNKSARYALEDQQLKDTQGWFRHQREMAQKSSRRRMQLELDDLAAQREMPPEEIAGRWKKWEERESAETAESERFISHLALQLRQRRAGVPVTPWPIPTPKPTPAAKP